MSHRKTTKGFDVYGCHKTTNVNDVVIGTNGRVRPVADDPTQDDYPLWDLSDRAINHDYGDLVREQRQVVEHDDSVKGSLDMMDSLVGGGK